MRNKVASLSVEKQSAQDFLDDSNLTHDTTLSQEVKPPKKDKLQRDIQAMRTVQSLKNLKSPNTSSLSISRAFENLQDPKGQSMARQTVSNQQMMAIFNNF